MGIVLRFVNSISNGYIEKLQTLMDNVLAQGLTANQPPDICFEGMNEVTYDDIQKIWDEYNNQ